MKGGVQNHGLGHSYASAVMLHAHNFPVGGRPGGQQGIGMSHRGREGGKGSRNVPGCLKIQVQEPFKHQHSRNRRWSRLWGVASELVK
jgi:hypothetical protein